MRIAFVCDTAYQVFNAINYVYANKQQNIETADLFVGHQFHMSETVMKRVQEEHVFSNVYGFCPPHNAQTVLKKFKRLYQIVTPMQTVKSLMVESANMDKKAYDAIFVSIASHFAVSLIFAYPKAEVVYYDDGLGSYNGYSSYHVMSKSHRIIYKLLGKDLNRLVPKVCYLNNPSFSCHKEDEKIESLPSLNLAQNDFWDMIKRIWDYRENGYYKDRSIVYLTQPYEDEMTSVEAYHERIINILEPYGTGCIVRPHPRQSDMWTGALEIDSRRDMWELVCGVEITDQHVLLSCFSTSQTLPKMIYDKEPYVIFFYRMIEGCFSQKTYESFDSIVDRMRISYRNPEKIFVPNSLDELSAVLSRVTPAEE